MFKLCVIQIGYIIVAWIMVAIYGDFKIYMSNLAAMVVATVVIIGIDWFLYKNKSNHLKILSEKISYRFPTKNKRLMTLIITFIINAIIFWIIVWWLNDEIKLNMAEVILIIGTLSSVFSVMIAMAISIIFFRKEENLDKIIMGRFDGFKECKVETTDVLDVNSIDKKIMAFTSHITEKEDKSVKGIKIIMGNKENCKMAISCIKAQLKEIKVKRDNLSRTIAILAVGTAFVRLIDIKIVNAQFVSETLAILTIIVFVLICVFVDEYMYISKEDMVKIKALNILKDIIQGIVDKYEKNDREYICIK